MDFGASLILGRLSDGRELVFAGQKSGTVWALDPATGHVESYEVNDQPKVPAQVRALAFAQDGTLWLVNGGTESVVRLDPRTRKYITYKVGIYPHDIALDSHGDVWLNAQPFQLDPERVARGE